MKSESTPQLSHPSYRPDIDGLRALAVLLVFAEHLKLPVTGGYVGVDVFFVISGYLISSVILKSLQAGTFTFAEFYERRIRRIVPALFVMLLGVSVMVYLYDTPSEVTAFGSSLLASVASVSNILFSQQAGYFDAPSNFKPLLHTWSLGVEEQFYIFFPLFLVAIKRWMPQKMRAAILTVAVGSFVLACFWVLHDKTAAYFESPLRAWELLLGTIISQHYLPRIQGYVKRNLIATIGLFCILVPAVMFNAETRFPGLAALPPCLGAAAIIMCGESGPTIVSRYLSFRPVVFIGLISYSLYLWHWPIIVFQNSANVLHLTPGDHGVALKIAVVSFALAALSWRFVERPFRRGNRKPVPRTLFLQAGVLAAAVVLVGSLMIISKGMPWRYPASALQVADYINYDERQPYRQDVCFLVGPTSSFSDFKPSTCMNDLSVNSRKQYLLFGDSHAASLYPGMQSIYANANVMQATSAGCRPFIPAQPDPGADRTCVELRDFVFEYLLQHKVEAVLLAGRWHDSDIPALGATVAWLQQHHVQAVIFGPSIEYDQPLPRVLAVSLRDDRPQEVERHRALAPESLDRELAKIARTQWHAIYISMYEDLCTSSGSASTTCPAYDGSGTPILFDLDHLTSEGSNFYARAIQARHQLP